MVNALECLRKQRTAWQTVMAVFVLAETALFSARPYHPSLYNERFLWQIGSPLTAAFAALAIVRTPARLRNGVWIAALYALWYVPVMVLNGRFFAYDFLENQHVLFNLLFTVTVCYPLGILLTASGRKGVMRALLCVLTAGLVVALSRGIRAGAS